MNLSPPNSGRKTTFSAPSIPHHTRPASLQAHRILPPNDSPCPVNQTMFQGFEWYSPSDHKHWDRLANALPGLAALGVSSMWIPPATKACWRESNGYDVYDLYDLGEFHQKGSTCTKWGTKEELVAFVEIANSHGVKILFDAVLNHKAGADYTETVLATEVDSEDRNKVTGNVEPIEAWTGFHFKNRATVHSSMLWNKSHFTGTDYDHKTKTHGVRRFEGKTWAQDVDEELGNYDYLMFADIDHKHPEVRQDLFNWVKWLSSQLQLGGLRLDAIKHYSASFVRDLLLHIDESVDPDWFVVGEYWKDDSEVLSQYIEYMNNRISLFDVKLLHNFSRLSLEDKGDLRIVLQGSLAALKPRNTVTFVANHDTQDGQSLEAPIAPYFVPIAYSLILLRANAGHPCVFYADLYGSSGRDGKFIPPTSGGSVLPKIMLTRVLYAYGPQNDYFDQPHCIGFTRHGHRAHSKGAGLAVLVSNDWKIATKRMNVGKEHAGERWTDILHWSWGDVVIDKDGWGIFRVGPRSVSVWASYTAPGRQRLDELVFSSNIFNLDDRESMKASPETKPRTRWVKKAFPEWLRPQSKSKKK